MELEDYIDELLGAINKLEALQDLVGDGKTVSACTNCGGFDISVWSPRDDDYTTTHFHQYVRNASDLETALDLMLAGAKLAKGVEP